MSAFPTRARSIAIATAVLEQVPTLLALTKPAAKRFLEFIAANIRNPHTRRLGVSEVQGIQRFSQRRIEVCSLNEFL